MTAAQRARESRRREPLFDDPYAGRLAGDRGRALARTVNARMIASRVIARTAVFDEWITRTVTEGGATWCRSVRPRFAAAAAGPGRHRAADTGVDRRRAAVPRRSRRRCARHRFGRSPGLPVVGRRHRRTGLPDADRSRRWSTTRRGGSVVAVRADAGAGVLRTGGVGRYRGPLVVARAAAASIVSRRCFVHCGQRPRRGRIGSIETWVSSCCCGVGRTAEFVDEPAWFGGRKLLQQMPIDHP